MVVYGQSDTCEIQTSWAVFFISGYLKDTKLSRIKTLPFGRISCPFSQMVHFCLVLETILSVVFYKRFAVHFRSRLLGATHLNIWITEHSQLYLLNKSVIVQMLR